MFNRWKKSKPAAVLPPEPVSEQAALSLQNYSVVASLLTDVGCKREVNEDSIRYRQPGDPAELARKGLLVVVADGMGGHSAGEVASQMAIEIVSRAYYEDKGDAATALKRAVEEANLQIFRASLGDDRFKGMGTTCTALVLQNGSAISAHVGDSRLYLIRDQQIYLMTEDHSAVMEMVKNGFITLDQARHHPDKNIILRALGSQPEVEVTTWEHPFPVRQGDLFLLCSDGLYDLVEDEEIKQAVLASDPRSACESLVALAKERGGYDNISVGIISLKPVEDDAGRQTPQTRELEVEK